MKNKNDNSFYYLLGVLTVLAGIFYILDASVFDTKEKPRKRTLKDSDSDSFKADLDALNRDFTKTRQTVLSSYGIQ